MQFKGVRTEFIASMESKGFTKAVTGGDEGGINTEGSEARQTSAGGGKDGF